MNRARPDCTLDEISLKLVGQGLCSLVVDEAHFDRVVRRGILKSGVSLDIATADFKAMLVPQGGGASSIVEVVQQLAVKGVEIRILHSGVPSARSLRDLAEGLPSQLKIRRCPRLHAKAVVIDCKAMYLGSANLTGAGLGAKGEHKRNFEWGVWTEATELIDAVLAEFNRIWEGCRCQRCKRRDYCPVPLEEPNLT